MSSTGVLGAAPGRIWPSRCSRGFCSMAIN